MDSIICCNIRGLNNPNKQEELKKFVVQSKVDLPSLVETNIKEENVLVVYLHIFFGWDSFISMNYPNGSNVGCLEKARVWYS